MNKTNILVTGAAGYIGSHVVKQLLDNGSYNITIIDDLRTGFETTIKTLQEYSQNSISFIHTDLSDWKAVAEIMAQSSFDSVIHFAASLIVPESVEKPLKYYLNNTANTANLINECIKNSVNRFIFSSTAAVYGEPPIEDTLNGLEESYPTQPINPYGQSKLFSETILHDAAVANADFKFVALRYFNVAGGNVDGLLGQNTLNATHLVKIASETALGKRSKMYIFGDDYATQDGTCIRDYIHVDDLASAHIAALEYLKTNESNVFNVGYGRGYSVKEVIETMRRVSGMNFEAEIQERRAGDPAQLISSNTKILKETAWKPKYNDLELICKTALEWERQLV
jgi:UDP-glucose 4-epimerase